MNKATQVYITILLGNILFCSTLGTVIGSFPVILSKNGLGETFMGISSAVELIAGILISLCLKRISKKIPANLIIALAMLAYGTIILLAPHFINKYIWLAMMAFFGVCWFSYFALSFAILNQYISNEKRGFSNSCITLAISIGLTLGTLLASRIGTANPLLFQYSGIVSGILAIAYASLKNCTAELDEEDHNKFSHIIKRNPQIFFGKFFQEYVSHMVFIFMVIYGIKNGFTAEQAALIVSFYTLSSIIDIPIGLTADRVNRSKLINFAIPTATLLVFGLYYFSTNYTALVVTIFLLGIMSGFLYISIIAELNSTFEKHELVHANSCLNFIANIGGLLSSLITGFLLERYGNIGIFLPILLIFISYTIFGLNKKRLLK